MLTVHPHSLPGCRAASLGPPESGRLVLCDSLRAVGQVLHRFRRIVGQALAIPSYQIVSAATNGLADQELFHLVFAFLFGICHRIEGRSATGICHRTEGRSLWA